MGLKQMQGSRETRGELQGERSMLLLDQIKT
jgi:hypothetical protein